MKSQSQYMVVYKDGPHFRNKYFGPFVSERMAEEFLDALPVPQKGGLKVIKSVAPYTAEEGELARDVILRQRHEGGQEAAHQ